MARARKALFDYLAGFIPGTCVLDLYSGSGGLGLEALSRGASEAWFVDNARNSIEVARQNALDLGFDARSRFAQRDVFIFLKHFRDYVTVPFDLVFAAPPYRIAEPQRLLDAISESGALAEGASVSIEYPRHTQPPDSAQLKLDRRNVYGETVIEVWDYPSINTKGESMTVEQALISALDYEHKVRDHYVTAANRTDDPKGKEIFGALGDEEQGHIDYLTSRLEAWKRDGILKMKTIQNALPTREWLARGKAKMTKVSLNRSYENEIKMLRDALKLEQDVSDHYRTLVTQCDGESQKMFRRFLEIEDGHTAIVQTEIDALEKNNFWFDLREFDLEAS
jgi:16S rRNA (guanine(966)-N(2))-methyltransferase RsmD